MSRTLQQLHLGRTVDGTEGLRGLEPSRGTVKTFAIAKDGLAILTSPDVLWSTAAGQLGDIDAIFIDGDSLNFEPTRIGDHLRMVRAVELIQLW